MYQSKYYTCEEVDERLLKGYYDDAVSKGYTGTFEQLQLELASVDLIDLNLLNSNAGYTLTEAVAKMEELSPVHPSIVRFRYTDKTYNKLRTLTYDSTKPTLLTKVTDISTYTLTLSEFNGDIFKSLLLEFGHIGFEGSMYITHSGTICGKVSIFGDSMGHVVNQEVLTNCVLSSDRTSLESFHNHTKIFKYERFFNLSNSSFQDRDGNIVPSHDNSLWYTSTYEMVPDAYVVCNTPAGTADKTISVGGYHTIPAHGGGSIKVKFTYANTVENPTLDISGTGAKPLYLGKDPVSPTNTWADGSIVEVFYDGENYRILSDPFENIRILQYFYDQDCIEFVHVVTDQDGKLLLAIRTNGEVITFSDLDVNGIIKNLSNKPDFKIDSYNTDSIKIHSGIHQKQHGSDVEYLEESITLHGATEEQAGVMTKQHVINMNNMNGQLAALLAGAKVTISFNPSVIYKDVETEVKITGSISGVNAEFILILEQGTMIASAENQNSVNVTKSYTLSEDSKKFEVNTMFSGSGMKTSGALLARHPIYCGFATAPTAITDNAHKLSPRTSAAGTYQATAQADGVRYFILVPTGIAVPTNFTMGGAPYVMTKQEFSVGGVPYNMLVSGSTYNTGAVVDIKAS